MKAYYENFELNAKYIGVKGAPWDGTNKNHWSIVVCNTNNNKWTMFDYWTCDMSTQDDILEAFCYWLEDCHASRNSFEDFCDIAGYVNMRDYPKAKKAYDLCKNSYRKWMRICGMTESESLDFLNGLHEGNYI